MKAAAYFLVSVILFSTLGCAKKHNFLHRNNKLKFIAIQPFGNYDTSQLKFLSQEISVFFDKKVLVLEPETIPTRFLLAEGESIYSADSLLQLLTHTLNKDIVEVIGITSEEIYTTRREKNRTENSLFDYSIRSVFGLGFQPGNCCIISGYKLRSPDPARYNRRLRTVVLHELGHNLGLKHCGVTSCIMSEKNGSLPLLDTCCTNYCRDCRDQL